MTIKIDDRRGNVKAPTSCSLADVKSVVNRLCSWLPSLRCDAMRPDENHAMPPKHAAGSAPDRDPLAPADRRRRTLRYSSRDLTRRWPAAAALDVGLADTSRSAIKKMTQVR
jgi:hypothetical protein